LLELRSNNCNAKRKDRADDDANDDDDDDDDDEEEFDAYNDDASVPVDRSVNTPTAHMRNFAQMILRSFVGPSETCATSVETSTGNYSFYTLCKFFPVSPFVF
jgi:hypothetical protein